MGRRHAYRDQRTALWSLFSPSIFIWVLAIGLRSWGWHSKHFYPLTHRTGPFGFLDSLLWCSKVTFESFTYNNSCCNLPLSPAISHRQLCLVSQGSVLVTNLFYSQHDAQSYIQWLCAAYPPQQPHDASSFAFSKKRQGKASIVFVIWEHAVWGVCIPSSPFSFSFRDHLCCLGCC